MDVVMRGSPDVASKRIPRVCGSGLWDVSCVFQRFVGYVEEDPLLRIHTFRFARINSKEPREGLVLVKITR